MRIADSRPRRGFTLVELLVVIAIIGILVALLLPAIQAAREASRRSACSNNLKQLGIALQLYDDVQKSLPAAWWLSNPPLNIGAWGISVLPQIEQKPLYDQYNFNFPAINEAGAPGKANIAIISTRLKVFECPSAVGNARIYDGGISGVPGLPTLTWRAAASDYCVTTGVLGTYSSLAYAGFPGGAGGNRHGAMFVVGPFGGPNYGRLADIIDGTSNTFLLGERTGGGEIYGKRVGWTAPAALKTAAAAGNGGGWGDALNGEHWISGSPHGTLPPTAAALSTEGECAVNCTNIRGKGFHSFHPSGCQFLMADASVQFIKETAAPAVIAFRITGQKREAVTDE